VRKAIEKDELNGEYWLLLGDCEFNLNNLSEAESCYQKVTEDEPDLIDGWISHAHFLVETGRSDEAIQITDKALGLHPDSTELLCRQVVNHYVSGSPKEAYRFFATAIDKDTDAGQILFEMMPELKLDQVILSLIGNKSKNV
jgi:tetratricopeptide (TPR) repeat protein